MGSRPEIYLIFDQIEDVVARAMAEEGKVNLLPVQLIPPTIQYDDEGHRALCAIVLTVDYLVEFNSRVRNLRA